VLSDINGVDSEHYIKIDFFFLTTDLHKTISKEHFMTLILVSSPKNAILAVYDFLLLAKHNLSYINIPGYPLYYYSLPL